MTNPATIEEVLLLACGVLWTLTYVIIIYNTFTSRLTGMPYFAVMLNIGWETVYSFITPHDFPQRAIDITWLALDAIILLQTLRHYHYSTPPLRLSFSAFLLGTLLVYATSVAVHWTCSITLDSSGAYSAFTINLFMSLSFIALFFNRRPRGAGQSVWVAVGKMAGTLCSSGAFYMADSSDALLNVLYVTTFVWDVVYIVLLAGHRVQQKRTGQEEEEEEHGNGALRIEEDVSSGGINMRISNAAFAEPGVVSWQRLG